MMKDSLVPSSEGAEQLLALHDKLDALEEKESTVSVAAILFVIAAVLGVLGVDHSSLVLGVNSAIFAVGGAGLSIRDLRGMMKKRSLRQEIEVMEEAAPRRIR